MNTTNKETAMSKIPTDLKYTRAHEWVRSLPNGSVEIGITDHAQHALGDLVFIELPEVGRTIKAGDACAVVESVKSASDVYSPVSGEVVESNGALASAPEAVNQDPYGGGWLLRVRLDARAGAPADLLSAAEYGKFVETEGG